MASRRRRFHHCLRGKRYLVRSARLRQPIAGTCDHPSSPQKEIRIGPHDDPWEELDTVLHEGIHGGQPDLSESAVTELATDLTGLLRKWFGDRMFPGGS